MKKICFITTVSITIKTFILETAKYLHENDQYEITFICDYDEDFRDDLPDFITYIPVRMNRGIDLRGFKAVFEMYRIFKKHKFDIVQYSTPNASFYAAIASKFANIPVRLYCQWGIAYVGFKGIKRKIFKSIEKTVCKYSTFIEPDSFGNLYFSQNEGLYSTNKSSVVWNGSASGIDLTKFDILQKNIWRKEIRSKYIINDDTFVVGFVGRITGDKGINELFEAYKKFIAIKQNSRLILIGNTEKSESVNEKLYEWSLNEEKIIYCGTTSEVEKYLSAMDVFVLPSYREGFGSVVIEAEAMGVPVIVTDIPGPTDAMVKGKTGIVIKKADVTSLIDALIFLHENKDVAFKLGNEGNLFVTHNFESEKLKKYILEDRNKLLEEVQNDKKRT